MSALDICSLERWSGLCERLGISEDTETYIALVNSHAEKHRAYHTLEHIAACLGHLDAVRHLSERPDEIEMALWFHDAIYQPFSATNEEDSAEWAADWLRDGGVDNTVIARISKHILNTKKHENPGTIDGQFMLDIDLSILGTKDPIYDEFERNVRREYRRVPAFIFRKRRKAILKGFLDRERLYFTDYFHERFGSQGRKNLTRALSNL